VTVVNVFASWCIPCRDEHPLLAALKAETGVKLYGINQKDAAENARAFLSELGDATRLGQRAALVAAAGALWQRQLGPLLEMRQAQQMLGELPGVTKSSW